MGFDEDFNKNYFSNVPYLDGAVNTKYSADISSILNNDISSSSVYSNVKNLNDAFDEYLSNRSSIGNQNQLDQQLLTAYKSNNEMIKQLTQAKIEKYKKLNNIQTHIDNNTSGNNELVTKILEGDDALISPSPGAIEITTSKLEKLNNEINEKERNLEINTYYEKKYAKQYKVIINVVILLSIILAVSFLFKIGLFGEKIFVSIIGLLLAFSVIYITYEVYDIFMRDNHNFDEYKYYTRPNVGLSVKENDVDIPLELRSDIPGFCKLKDKYLDLS